MVVRRTRLTDKRWQQLHGGYRTPFDASVPLIQLEAGEPVWDELWEELHHQGDVGEASYAAVPHLVRIAQGMPVRDWNTYALVALIEIERHRKKNPPLPAWLQSDYEAAWQDVAALALKDLVASDDPLTVHDTLTLAAYSLSQDPPKTFEEATTKYVVKKVQPQKVEAVKPKGKQTEHAP